MSREIDERIVQMQFDNAQFEAGVKTTLGSLSRLKESLSFSGTESSGMVALQNNVAAISDRFSALGIVATTVLQNIANKAVDVGSRLLKSLTIEGAMDGFGEYELKLDSVQTIMAGTGESLATVSKYLEELNTYADKTIYSFSDMTSSIGKFTNAGVSLDQAVKAIQGVSNEAALSGANAQQASHAMYNFAQALSSGAVKLIDWKSIENANMATKEFKEELIKTAVELGTVKKKGDQYVSTTTNAKGKTSEAFDAVRNFNDSLQSQWMTTEVLVQTLGRYADETTDIGKRAFAAAQDVKTFSQLVDTLKEAVGSGWGQTFEIIVGNFDEAKELWTAVSNELGSIIDQQSQARNELLQGWKDAGGRSELIGAFRNIYDAINSYVKPIKEAFNDIFSPVGPLRLAGLSEQFKIFTSHLRLSDEAMLNLHNTFRGVFSVVDFVLQPIQALLRVFADYMDIIPDVEYGILGFTGRIGDFIAGIANAARESDIFYNVFSKAAEVIATVVGGIGNVIAALKPYIPSVDELSGRLGSLADKVSPLAGLFDKAKESVAAFFDSFRKDKTAEESMGLFGNLLIFFGKIMAVAQKAGTFLGGLFQKVGQALSDVFTGLDFDRILDILNGFMTVGIGAGIANFFHSLSELTSGAGDFMGGLTDILDGVTGSLEAFQTKLKAEALVPIAVAIGVLTASLVALSAIDSSKLAASLGALTTMFIQLGVFMAAFMKMVNSMEDGEEEPKGLGEKIEGLVKGVLGIGGDDDDKLGAAAKAMIALAGAVLVLSASVAILSNLSWEELAKGLLAVMAELTASAMILSKSEGKLVKGAAGLVAFAAAIRVLSGAVVSMSGLDWEGLAKGLIGVGVLMAELVGFLKLADFDGIGLMKGLGLIALAESLKMMSSAVASMGALDLETLAKGLAGVGAVLLEVAAFSKMTEGAGNLVGIGAGMAVIGASMLIFSKAVESMGSLDMEVIGKGLLTMAASLAVIGAAVNMMPATLPLIGTGLLIFASALLVVGNAVRNMGQMSWDEIAKGLVTLAGALTAITVAVNFMSGALAGAAAMLVIAGALAVLAPVLKTMGGMSVTEVATALITLAGAFTVIGVAGAVLTPLVPTILALGGAVTLIGVGVGAAGAGLMLLAAALVSVSAGATAAAAALGAAITIIIVDLVKLIPTVLAAFGQGLIQIAAVIAEGAPVIGEAFVNVGLAILNALEQLIPKIIVVAVEIIAAFLSGIASVLPDIVLSALAIIAGFLEGIAQGLPDVIQAGFDLILAFLNSMAEAVRFNDKSLMAAFRNLISSVIELFLSSLQALVQGIPVIGKQMSDALEGAKEDVHRTLAPESFYKMGDEAGKAVGDGFSARSGDFGKAADDAANKGLESLKRHDKDYSGRGGNFGDSLTAGFSGKSGEFGKAADDTASGGLSKLEAFKSKFGATGTDSGQSYISGLSSTQGSLGATSTGLATLATGNLSGALGVFSNIGGESGASYVSGMASNNDKSGNEGSALAKNATDSLSAALGTFKDAGSNSGINYISGIRSQEGAAKTSGSNLAEQANQGASGRKGSFEQSGNEAGTAYHRSVASKAKEAKAAGESLSASAAQGVKSKNGEFKTAGENAGSGFLSGLGSFMGSIRKKASELASNALNAFRGTLDEHSPSKETEKSGVNFDLGAVQGMDKKAGQVEDAAENVAEGMTDALKPLPSWSQRVGEQVSAALAKGVDDKRSETEQAAEKTASSLYSTLQTWANRTTKFERLSTKEQLELWENILEQFDKGSDQWWSAHEKVFDLRDKVASEHAQSLRDTYNNEVKAIENGVKHFGYSIGVQIEMYENVRDMFEEGSQEWIDANEKVFDKEQELLKKRADEWKQYYDDVSSINKDIAKLEEDYQKKLSDRSREIFNSYKLFGEVQEKEKVSGRTLLNNLRLQIDSISEFYANLEALKKRGVGTALVEEIRSMGVGASEELKALLRLSETDLQAYSKMFGEKQELANSIALKELENLRSDTDRQIREHLAEIEELYDSHAPVVGEAFPRGLAKGILSGESMAVDAAIRVAKAVEEAVRRKTETHSPSRVYQRIAYGGWIGGMVKGLLAGRDILQNTASTVSQSALSAFTESFAQFEGLPDIDMTPTITPVLDLDSISADTKRMNGLFDNYQTVRLRGYAEFVEGVSVDMAEFDADNRNIVAALRTLHEDMTAMREDFEEVQIILDTGVLVGEMARPMNDELGRIQDWEGRGM